ncbi:hypothetical protein FAZ95_13905 [Trinickia violacea]|uniref:Helix-turn-helix domain-containing protein n=1 Tax=Trinickia violacea TaxID=2571746 RepID=A0A4P8IQ96_9BURK|nr:helix-turn-helix domain-containing protein [Trinickia violacea]QCP50177.1 hypothetical protein FAZ95_13905 [Trinickia violacea]
MSGKLTGMVFDRYPEGGGELILALKLADNAHDDGTHIFPSVDTMAEKTRQSRRAVQYQLKRMREAGWLILVRAARGGRESAGRPAEYRINPEWIKGADFASLKLSTENSGELEKGADFAPNKTEKGANGDKKGCKPAQKRVQNEAEKGAKLLHPNHQLTIKEPSAAATAHEREAVDNVGDDPPPQSLLLPESKKTETPSAGENASGLDAPVDDPPDGADERAMVALLQDLERDRGKAFALAKNDRVQVLTWVGRGVTLEQLREAHRRAVAARERDSDDRPVNAGFVARFVEEVLATPAARDSPSGSWWESDSGIEAKAETVGISRQKDESTPHLLVRVAKAARDKAAIEFALKAAERVNPEWYHQVRAFFGDALLPVDDYPS